MISIRYAHERGEANFGWLESKHTFSFGDYYDPNHMGFSSLRVINDDIVQPQTGFDTHGHRNMEIISVVLSGEIEHKDSEGNSRVLGTGEYQLMSAGSGIYHSEYNASDTAPLHFLQIWIQPDTLNGTPGYRQKAFPQTAGLTPIVTPTGSENTLQIKQDVVLNQVILEPNTQLVIELDAERNYYLHQVTGEIELLDLVLHSGDGVKIAQEKQLQLSGGGSKTAKALLFDLPMV